MGGRDGRGRTTGPIQELLIPVSCLHESHHRRFPYTRRGGATEGVLISRRDVMPQLTSTAIRPACGDLAGTCRLERD